MGAREDYMTPKNPPSLGGSPRRDRREDYMTPKNFSASGRDCPSCHLVGLSLSYRTAPLPLRERFAFSSHLKQLLPDLMRLPQLEEGVLLSTCNRTEIYALMESPDAAPLVDWLALQGGLSRDRILPHLDLRWGEEAIHHLFRVVCGLDSMVLGEPQILGQVKEAYRTASEMGATGQILNRLFQHAFRTAKQIRSRTGVGQNPISLAYAAVRLAQQLFEDLGTKTALLIGAGEMVELSALHLRERGIGRLLIANRTVERARRLAQRFQAEPLRLEAILQRLPEADLVVTSTASPLPILGKGAVEAAIRKRRHRPIFMVDLAVPRDIEPEVAELPDVYLYSLDDLEAIVRENRRLRERAAERAEALIGTEVERFLDWLRLRRGVETICALRSRGEVFKQKALRRALRALRGGRSPEEALLILAHTLTNQWLHLPSIAVREAAKRDREELIAAIREIFRLDGEGETDQVGERTGKAERATSRRDEWIEDETGDSETA